MLNIRPVNFLRSFNYNTNFKNNTNSKINNFSYNNLKPLTKDTISFTGERQLTDIRSIVKESDANFEEISQYASVAENRLKKTLTGALGDLVESDKNKRGIIEPIAIRVKSPDSIEEKVISILAQAVAKADPTMLFKIENSQSIKEHVNDIIGARVILRQSNTKNNAQIINRLINAVRKNELNIKKIEVTQLPERERISPYFDDKDLERLEKEVNLKRGRNNQIKIKRKPSTTGYCGIHIDLDLSNKNAKAIYDGYSGEIQIIGSDVAQLKEVEDCCYKVKQDKSIVGKHPAYNPFVQHLDKYFKFKKAGFTEEENKAKAKSYKDAFSEYTYKAYIQQRKKDHKSPDYDPKHLPSLEECGMTNKLPPDLDFNHLQKIKESCDKIYELSKKGKISQDEVTAIIGFSNLFLATLNKLQNQTIKTQMTKNLNELYQLTASKDA